MRLRLGRVDDVPLLYQHLLGTSLEANEPP